MTTGRLMLRHMSVGSRAGGVVDGSYLQVLEVISLRVGQRFGGREQGASGAASRPSSSAAASVSRMPLMYPGVYRWGTAIPGTSASVGQEDRDVTGRALVTVLRE